MIEKAYRLGEALGLPVWCQDEGGPYQAIPQGGASWQPEGRPARRSHQYVRGGTAKLLTLFRPATGELRGEPVEQSTNAILHPWLKRELSAILKQCPPAPTTSTLGRRWVDWRWHEGAEGLDRHLSPIRMVLIWDNLKGHVGWKIVQWCAERGICLLYTPIAGSWLNMAESVQRIIIRRALSGRHATEVSALMSWLRSAILVGWNRDPTPFEWGGKRHARRDRAYARQHRLGGSGATTKVAVGRRVRSVSQYHASLPNAS